MEHLHTVAHNRRRGAQKAAATRRAKKLSAIGAPADNTHSEHTSIDSAHCRSCGRQYKEETEEEEEFWIGCDKCNLWFYSSCECLDSPPSTDTYVCSKCCKQY